MTSHTDRGLLLLLLPLHPLQCVVFEDSFHPPSHQKVSALRIADDDDCAGTAATAGESQLSLKSKQSRYRHLSRALSPLLKCVWNVAVQIKM